MSITDEELQTLKDVFIFYINNRNINSQINKLNGSLNSNQLLVK